MIARLLVHGQERWYHNVARAYTSGVYLILELEGDHPPHVSHYLGRDAESPGYLRRAGDAQVLLAATYDDVTLLLREENHNRANRETLRCYAAGERVGVSTGIDDVATMGFGRLDEHGFFEFPLYYSQLRADDRLRELDFLKERG